MKTAPLLTIGGTLVDCFDPKPGVSKLALWEVAHALSQLVRFTGNMFGTYSVAQHSVHCMEIIGGHQRMRRTALFHDAAEMFVGDVPGPLKRAMGPEYKQIELGIEAALAERFDLIFPFPKEIKTADLRLLETEMRDLTAWPLEQHLGQEKERFTAEDWPGPLDRELVAWSAPFAFQQFIINARKLGAS